MAQTVDIQLTQLRFYVPLNIKWVISKTFFPANLLVHSNEETEPNATKANNARTKLCKLKQKHKMLNRNKHTRTIIAHNCHKQHSTEQF